MEKVKNHNSFIINLFCLLLALLPLSSLSAQGDPVKGETLFKTNCMACHQLDKRAVGPALGGVTERRTNE